MAPLRAPHSQTPDDGSQRSVVENLERKARMPEAEVSIRLALYLMQHGIAVPPVKVAIDGAQIQTGQTVHFPIMSFLESAGCVPRSPDQAWRGEFRHLLSGSDFSIHANPGCGDVVANLRDGRTLRVESKKGPLERSTSSQEYPLLREALGQLLTMESVGESDVLAVAVPRSAKFLELARRWREAPLVRRAGILILTVGQDSEVEGLTLERAWRDAPPSPATQPLE